MKPDELEQGEPYEKHDVDVEIKKNSGNIPDIFSFSIVFIKAAHCNNGD